MARLVQLQDIREDVRQRCDLDTFSATSYVTATAVNRMINTSIHALRSLLMQAWGEGYFTKQAALSTVADTATTALPSDFSKMVTLVWKRGKDDIVPVFEAQIDEYSFTIFDSRTWDLPRYRLRENEILWFPNPDDVYNLFLEYVYHPADLSLDTDTFEAGPNWEEWVVVDVCRKVFEREEKNTQPWMMERARVEELILSTSPYRSETSNHHIREIDDEPRYGTRELRNLLWRNG